MELWAHNIDFKGFDVRFRYDQEKFTTSDVDTNETTSEAEEFFEFEPEFKGVLEMFNAEPEPNNGIVKSVVSFYPPVEESPHIIPREDGTKIVTSKKDGEVDLLLGRMSFKMLTETFDMTSFALVADEDLTKGIRINIDGTYYYDNPNYTNKEAPCTFIFEDATASKDADLLNIEVSSEKNNEDGTDNTVTTIYDLEPEFKKEETNYTVTLYDYIDEVNIKATQSDENATMKIKIPEHDSEGNLVYKDEGTKEIQYEEKELTNEVPFGVTLNKLGDPDTVITITVTAEDGSTTKEYTITIKRPYGIIKGKIHTMLTAYKETYTADIRVYKTSDVEEVIDKSAIVEGIQDEVHEQLLTIESRNCKTEPDGTFEIYVVPGTYDILLDKKGYLDHIYDSRAVHENETLELGEKELLAGDVNKDGVITITDLTLLQEIFGVSTSEDNYNESMNFNEDDYINITDLTALLENYLESRKIV